MQGNRTLENVLDLCRRSGVYAAEHISVNERDAMGDSPLHIVASLGDVEAVGILVQGGADVNAVGDRGRTPIFSTESIEVIRVLLKSGAKIEHRDDDGKTVRDLAQLLKRSDLLKLFS